MNSDDLRDYYGLLEVSPHATISEIHKAYWKQALCCHPDRGGSNEAMAQVVEAWKILADPDSRARYDQLLKYRHSGWRSRKFDENVQNVRRRTTESPAQSWEEFEAVYQKAFFTFNQDFYGEDLEEKATGPYSPLMGTGIKSAPDIKMVKNSTAANELNSRKAMSFTYISRTFVLLATILALSLLYRNYSGTGRYLPIAEQNSSRVLIMDTTNGKVFSVEKRDAVHPPSWKEAVADFSWWKKVQGK